MKMNVASSPLSFIINSNSTMPMYNCTDCSYKTSSLRKLGRHKSVNHAGVKYRCEHCDFVTGYQSNYYRHRKQVHSNVMHNIAPKLQPNVKIVQQQAKPKPNNNYYTAAVNRLNIPPRSLPIVVDQQAKNYVTPTRSTPLVVERTQQKLSTQITTTIIDEKNFDEEWICSECGAEFRSKLRLDIHFKAFHVDNEKAKSLPFTKIKEEPLALTNHHQNGKLDVEDEQAKLSAASIEYLTKSAKRLDDDDVEMALDLRKNDVESQKTTENQSPDVATPDFDGLYRCNLCPYTTSESVRYRKHVRCHQTTAPTKCDFCNFSTVYSWNLDRHVRCHKTQSRYTCRRCSFSQNTRQSMSFHLQHHHTTSVDEKSSQTDVSWLELESENVEFDVDVGYEPFIFEKHAVMRNDDVVNMQISHNESPLELVETPPTVNDVCIVTKDDYVESALKNSPKTTTNVEENGKIVRKYLSERDAIELPSEKFTFEETNDPDIKNRFCSICGYQGKWISEMIRHKRVHTNERPFKCKYCDRTSKWKADLIRHVSKVHGIRVVSKYSRSHTFESDANVVRALKDAHKIETADAISDGSMISDVVSDQGSDRCNTAELEHIHADADVDADVDDEFVEMADVVDDDENTFEIQRQNFIYQQHQQQLSEFAQQLLLAHMASTMSSPTSTMMMSNNGVVGDHQTASAIAELKDLRDVIGNKQITGALEKYITVYQSSEGEPILKCRICPYETRDLHTFRAHTQKHENKKPYQCSSCGYRSNWSSDVHKHIRLKKTGHDRAFVIKLNENECSSSTTSSSSTSFVPNVEKVSPISKNGVQLSWKCEKCEKIDESRTEIIEHLSKIHNSPPYECRFCNFSSLYRKTCVYHVQSQHNCAVDSSNGVVENLTFEYNQKNSNRIDDLSSPKRISIDKNSSPIDNRPSPTRISIDNQHFVGPPPNVVVDKNEILQPFKRSHDVIVDSPSKFMKMNDETKASTNKSIIDEEDENECRICPFISSNVHEMNSHRKAHVRPKGGLMCYKCVFCEFYAKKKNLIVDHLKLHTNDPLTFMAEVERNLITPLANRAAADVDNASNALLGLSGVEKQFKCDLCSFETNFSKNLQCHMKIHDQKSLSNVEDPPLDLTNNHKSIVSQPKSIESIVSESKSIESIKKSIDSSATSSNTTGFLHFKDVSDVISDFNAFFKNDDDDDVDGEDQKAFFRQLQSLTNGDGNFAVGLKSFSSPVMNFKKAAKDQRKISSENGSFYRSKSMIDDELNEPMSDHDETVDPEAYIHAGEEGLGDEQLFAEMVPKDIQKVNAMVDGQMRKMWQCRYCSHVSKRRANIRMHEKKHFKPNAVGLLKCPKCSYRGDKRSLKIHFRTHVSPSDYVGFSQKFPCSYCPAIFRKREVLDVHAAFHGGHNRYRCTQCSYAVPSQQQLTQHAQVHKNRSMNGNAAQSKLNCSTNGNAQSKLKSIVDDSMMKKHSNGVSSPTTTMINGQQKAKKHQCRFCPAKFTDRTQIQRHEHFHGVNLKYKCHLCDYSVPFPINLSKHLKSHHGLNLISNGGGDSTDVDDDDAEENVTAQLESEAFDQYLHNPNGFASSSATTPTLNGLKMKINLGKLASQTV